MEKRFSDPLRSPAAKFCGPIIAQHSMLWSTRLPRKTICVDASIFHSRTELSVEQLKIRVFPRDEGAFRMPLMPVMRVSCPYLH